MSPPRKYPVPSKDINILSTKKYQSLPPQLAKFLPRFKSLRNKTEYDRNNSADTSRTDKEDYVKKLKAINNKDIDDKYKDENSKDHNSNESVTNKTK